MARLAPFRGTTYDTARVSPQDVVCPPYDVVSPPQRAALARRSPYNAIEVELPEEAPGVSRYDQAARLWRSWHEEGVVVVAPEPAFYLYKMTFRAEDGSERATTGVFGALGIDSDERGEVLPHEETTPKDRTDRLSLLRAARTNFSPIWGLSLAAGLGRLCEEAVAGAGKGFKARDDSGATHECWTMRDPAFLSQVSSLVATAPVLLADGHHRYETAGAYLKEAPHTPGTGAVLALVIELSEEQLNVEAIHRLIRGVAPEELVSHLARTFEVKEAPASPSEVREAMASEGALGLLTPGRNYLLAPRSGDRDELDSARLRNALEGLGDAEVVYQHGLAEVTEAVASGVASAAVLLRPVSVRQIAATAHGAQRMPPKSTFFYPKLLTGTVFRELDAG